MRENAPELGFRQCLSEWTFMASALDAPRKKQALAQLPQLFADRRAKAAQEEETLRAARYQEIGQLKVELDWLKKSGTARLS